MSESIVSEKYGVVAEFNSPADLLHAAEALQKEGFTRYDVFSPFPIHGMDDAMGLKKSPLGYITFVGGLGGMLFALVGQWWTQIVDYPIIVHGKPVELIGTLPAFFPVIFEITILASAFTIIFGMMVLTGLPRWNHPLFEHERFEKVSDDGFFAAIEVRDPKYDEDAVQRMLHELGGRNITAVYSE
ncbi:MAG: DUF3341 domain-containing protein [Verrucomicrobiales bacterium]